VITFEKKSKKLLKVLIMKNIMQILRGKCQKMLENYLNLYKNFGLILMLHEIKDYKDIKRNDRNYVIRPCELEDMIVRLDSKNVNFLALNDLLIAKNKSNKEIFFTFDDGYEDVYLFAYPILVKYNIPFCLFLTVSLIGKPGYLSKKQIQEMSANSLCTIGAHAINHVKLRHTVNSVTEIQGSRIQLEQMFNKKIDLFAYPYGSFNACSYKNIKEVEESDYRYGFSTLQTGLTNKMFLNKYYLPRMNINSATYKKIIETL
jgi:Predicted xylanase/chitin deacetylase